MKNQKIQEIEIGNGQLKPYFSLLAVTIVTIGVTLLFQNNAKEIDRLRLENMAAKVTNSLSDAIGNRQLKLASLSDIKTQADGKPFENADTYSADGVLKLESTANPPEQNQDWGVIQVNMPADLKSGFSITPSAIDEKAIAMSRQNDTPIVSTIELTKPDGAREHALIILGLPKVLEANDKKVISELPFSIMTMAQISELIAKSLPNGELAIELRSKKDRIIFAGNADSSDGSLDLETARPLKLDHYDSGLIIGYAPRKSFWKESTANLTILIPFIGALLGMLLYTLLRFDASYAERLTTVAKELDAARTEKIALLEREQFARKEAEKANIAKDEFMATISHEIRTPLNAIGGWAKILENEDIPVDTKQEAFKTIKRNIKKQSQIINELLLYSSLSGETAVKTFDLVDAPALIGEVVEIVRPAAEAKKIEFFNSIKLNNEKIYCDRKRVTMALRNLFSNAIKFTPSGGEIRFYADKQDDFIRLLIKDNGKGIDRELLPYIFDKFKQSDSSTTRQFGGLGLGLAIAKRIIKLHGGFISVRSAGENAGSEFEIKLPAGESPV